MSRALLFTEIFQDFPRIHLRTCLPFRDYSDRRQERFLWRELAEGFDRAGKVFEQTVDVLVCVFVSKAEADRSAGEFVLTAEGADDR